MSWFESLGKARVPSHVPAPDRDRELVLFKYAGCPYCERVERTSRNLGLDLPMRDTVREPDARRELIALTGGTQVPMLLVDGEPLLESADINAWLTAYAARER